jgi:hypothetical protein
VKTGRQGVETRMRKKKKSCPSFFTLMHEQNAPSRKSVTKEDSERKRTPKSRTVKWRLCAAFSSVLPMTTTPAQAEQ